MCFPQNVKAILYIEAASADEFADKRILADIRRSASAGNNPET